jgi:hypothetical protein
MPCRISVVTNISEEVAGYILKSVFLSPVQTLAVDTRGSLPVWAYEVKE